MSSAPGEVLVTAFEPFGGRQRNRSWDVARRLAPGQGLEIVQLPVDFERLKASVPAVAEREPRALLLLGEAPTNQVCVEQVALNVIDSDRPDNAGAKPRAQSIVAGGPLALPSTWDARAVAQKLTSKGIPASASFHAGTFACNAALYLALRSRSSRTSVGFLHIPYQRWPIGFRLGLLVRAVEVAIDALRRTSPAPLGPSPQSDGSVVGQPIDVSRGQG